MIADTERRLQHMDQQYKEAYDDYISFCNEVLVPLINSPDEPSCVPEGFCERYALPVDQD